MVTFFVYTYYLIVCKCNRNMNKKLIRLTESDLHRIVRYSVNKLLRESVEDKGFGLEDLDYDGFYMNRFLMAKEMEIETKTDCLTKGSNGGNVSVYDFLNHDYVLSSYERESYDELLINVIKAFKRYKAAGGTEKLFHNRSVGEFVVKFYLEVCNKLNELYKAHGESPIPLNNVTPPNNKDLSALLNLNDNIFANIRELEEYESESDYHNFDDDDDF